uniref:ABC transporter permease n=1 Tax=Tolypiocladia glomerulata TaxID=860646 RepID=A0A1Z1MVB0_9FLOR|nr:hypothetical protein [Tolypiocladia glomerulata]ARW69674.1 hypothetical protein [Tolypiocladia glomerulata]
MINFLYKTKLSLVILVSLFNPMLLLTIDYRTFLKYIKYSSIDVLFIVLVSSFFISLVLSLQIVKEFLYLNAVNLVSSILAISFIRELSPVLTSLIVIGKVGSLVTSEIGTMVVNEQIDALFILGIDPIRYVIYPRIISLVLTLPCLNLFALITSFISCSFICFYLYDMSPSFFFINLFYKQILFDFIKSMFKMLSFGLLISIVSCVSGITTVGGSRGVGLSTTSSVVTSMILVFIFNFILSYLLFDNGISSFSFL